MKKLIAVIFIMFFLPLAFAVNLDVKDLDSDKVLIVGVDEPTHFEVEVTNNGANDAFSFYTFFEGGMEPKEAVEIKHGETKNVEISVYPRLDSKLRGFATFSYFIQGRDRTEIEEKSLINLVELEDAFNIGSTSFDPESNSVTIYIENKVNFDFSEVEAQFSSPFFTLNEKFQIGSKETKEFTINLNKEDFNKLAAGFYTLKARVLTKGVSASIEGKIEFVEKDLLKTNSVSSGFIISKKVIEKVNDGNTISQSSTTVKKNIFSRLFTTFSPEPDVVDREGMIVYYTWNQRISPGESEKIIVRTNWLIPFLLIFFIITIVYFVKKYATQKLVIRKRVNFVRAKGGEFALKVTIVAEAREFIEKIRIIDRLPPLVKMYEKFAGEMPDRITKDQRKLEWEFSHLDAGEKRVMTYVVYSKVGVLGRFALPPTIGLYEKDGKLGEVNSNKAYFLSEQKERRNFD